MDTINASLKRGKTNWLPALIALAVNIGLDRLTKILAGTYLKDRGTISVIGNFFVLYYIENDGAFLSMGSGWLTAAKYLILLIIPLAVCILGVLYCLFREKNKVRLILIATIIAGGLSNLYDRMTNSFRVIDFMNFGVGKLRTGILNIADLSITFGFIILLIYEYARRNKDKQNIPQKKK